jgi:hypothetical protein
MKISSDSPLRWRRGLPVLRIGVLLALSLVLPARAQYEVPQLLPGAPNPFTPPNAVWNRDAAFTPGGGGLRITNWWEHRQILQWHGFTVQNRVGAGVVPLAAQYGVGDPLAPPTEATDLLAEGWVPRVSPTNGNPFAVQWLPYANTNLFVAVDEGVAVVVWTNALATNQFTQTYVIGPNLSRRPVRLFWTEGQYSGPRVRFGNNYEVKIYYNSQVPDPYQNPANVTHIANENISAVSPASIFIKNSELRAMSGVQGRVLIAYSRRPEGVNTNRELLGFEVVDVLEPMSSTLAVHVGDRLLPKRTDNSTNALFCDITRGGVDTTGVRPDEIFAYKHMLGARNGWVWAIRPTDAPWQLEIFWKAKEQLDVIWPFEVDIYDVTWNLDSQLCALVTGRQGTPGPVYIPQEVAAQVMPYQAAETVSGGTTNFPKATSAVATVAGRMLHPLQAGLCTLKYTVGEDVWFETVRIVPELSPLVYQGVRPWAIGQELRPFARSGAPGGGNYDTWPGMLRIPSAPPTGAGITNTPGDRWDRYHPTLYQYPPGYPVEDAGLASQVFAVNAGHLSVWWWNPTALAAREGMPTPIYWPSRVCDYRNEWPAAPPEIVIASFQGSAYGGLFDDGTGSLQFLSNRTVTIQGTSVVTNEWQDPLYDVGFTFETWIKPTTVRGYRGVMSMRAASGYSHLSFFIKDGLPGMAQIRQSGRTITTNEWFATQSVLPHEWSHVGFSVDPEGELRFHVNGQPAGNPGLVLSNYAGRVFDSVQLGAVFSWAGLSGTVPFGYFRGWMDETRLWWGAQSDEDVLARHAGAVDVNSEPSILFRFDYDANRLYPARPGVLLPLDGTGVFYLDSPVPNEVELDLSPEAGLALRRAGRAYPGMNPKIYVQNDVGAAGYNPNEEHALMVGSVAYALRCDLNRTNQTEDATSLPFVLVEYTPDPAQWPRAMDVYQVVVTNRDYPRFLQHIEAGRMIQPPAPLRSVLPDNCARTDSDLADRPYLFRDRLRYFWAQQAGDDGDTLEVGMRFFYPMQLGFWIPQLSADSQPAPLTEVPWLSALDQPEPTPATVLNGTPVRVAFAIQWPAIVPTLSIGDTLTLPKNNLPAVRGQKSVRIVYQQSAAWSGNDEWQSAVLIDPTRARKVTLTNVPPRMRAMRDPRTGNTFFSDLDPDLRERLFFVPTANPTERLQLKGLFVEYPNYHYLRLNLLTPDLIAMAKDAKRVVGIDLSWTNAIDALPTERVTMTDENQPFDSMALCTPGLGAGYVTLLFNNSTNLDMVDPGDPIDMKVIRIATNLFRGRIDIIQSANPLDKYMTLRHISDFSGRPDQWAFEWQYAAPEGGLAPTNDSSWLQLINSEPGRYTTLFGSSGEFGLGDTYVRCRYRALDARIRTVVSTNWSGWTEPVLCEGWIKRVLKAINPFDQRIRDYMNYALNLDLSMIQQAGQPYAGDVPMNLDALNEYGLIPIYQTVLEQSRGLSIDSTLDPMGTELRICLALMLAAGRLNDLYMVLGNEAYADALNPSLALGNNDPVLAGEAPSIFAFQGIVPTLLDEELALLRGRDCSVPLNPPASEFPIHNRLPWNFTADISHGQLAYALNYGISDLKGNQNGVVDSEDAAALYPQGHGDAWGHYLAALKSYYYLFRHRNFTWFPQLEGIRVGTVEVTMSALHELKFAASAAARAKTGLAIMDRTYSQSYAEGRTDAWTVQRDIRPDRAWGVGEWGARVTMGAYFDWVMANALLPHTSDPTNLNPLAVIDRTTVPELTQIVLAASEAQQMVDMADRGMNPLGLGTGAVPFDISPAEIDQGRTHFEQAYTKALEALKVARGVFDRIQTCTAALRDQNEERDLDTVVFQQEQAYERQLLDIYGFPYQEDIGPGKLYPEGYLGPDIQHYAYINRYDFFGRLPLDTSLIQSTVVRPTIVGSGTRIYNPGELVPPLPSSDPDLGIEDILSFISPEYAERFAQLKARYTQMAGYAKMSRRAVDQLGIPELSAFYNEVFGVYDALQRSVFGAVQNAVAWFDGVISAPVDAIDDFISQWVGPTETLDPLQIAGPDISYTTNTLTFWVGPDGLPTKPANYTSARRAEGEIQVALSQYVLALREATAALANSEDQFKKIHVADMEYRNKVGAQITAYYDSVNALNQMNSLQQIMATVDKAIALVTKVYDDGMELYNALEAAIPSVAGFAFDIGAAVRGPARVAAAAVNIATTVQKLANKEQIVSTAQDVETGKRIIELNATNTQLFQDSTELALKVVDAALAYLSSLDNLDVALQKAETFRMQYARAVAAGDMVQVEREQARRIWASDLTGRRYRNMAYQIMRNDDLVRYEQTFAMARRYVYLAAKAYDYETGLLRHDGAVGAPGREFLSQIVRARALGRFAADGTPLPGGSTGDPGLADIMARMSANWTVLEGRLNFNNPQSETGMFSLRQELFRIPPGGAFDKIWREQLTRYKVADVRDVLEYRTHCLPFSPEGAAEPGLVIPFATTIDFRKNFFGLPLAAGDNAYDSTHFATKVRGVGVWFSNYRNSTLANQPRVYLVPVGEDRLRVPDGIGETIRSWSILDQALPIPYPLSNESWMRPDWNVRTDVLGGEFFARRRLPSLRAYHDSGFNVNEMTTNSRLIGRSVWNTRWLLIIPGGTLLDDANRGLEQFIHGRELAPGSGTYDGQGVKDIKLYFLTYAYSGN